MNISNEMHENMRSKRFIINKKRVGSFWALYLTGITSVTDLMYTVLLLTLQMICGAFVAYQFNRIILLDTSENPLIRAVIIQMMHRPVSCLFTVWLTPYSDIERIRISEKITNWVYLQFNASSHSWRRNYPNKTQAEAMSAIFNIYHMITWNIAQIITSSADTLSFVAISFYNSWIIGCVVIMGTVLITMFRRQYNTKLDKMNLEIGGMVKEIRINTSNQYTNHALCLVNHQLKPLMDSSKYYPIDGLAQGYYIWGKRDNLANMSRFIGDTVKGILLFFLCVYMSADRKIAVWIMINGYRLFGITDIIARIDDIKNMSIGRIISHLELVDALDFQANYDTDDDTDDDTDTKSMSMHMTDCDESLDTIHLGKMHYQLTDEIYIKSTKPVTIDFKKPGIIRFDGKKGSGKSLSLDVWAGQYDGRVFDSMQINGSTTTNEFRNLTVAKKRFTIQQLVSDTYRANQKGTITMTLSDLFPDASYQQICEYLVSFDLLKKIPPNTHDVLNISLGKNERSFSPGELQSMVLASLLYKANKLKTRFLLLDEPERNIDNTTVKNIFDNIIIPMMNNHQMTIVIVTHNDELKLYLSKWTKLVLYFQNDGKNMIYS